jgi:cytochrome c oxidase cbb3-type subunit I/II
MWTAGITQGLMWQAVDETGKLVYPNFVETVVKIIPMYWVRAFGGTLVLFGFVVLVYNIYKTIKLAPKSCEEEKFKALPLSMNPLDTDGGKHRKLEGIPLVFSVLSLLAILVGSVIELVPSLVSNQFIVKDARVKPYTPLEVAGRDIYVREGCYTCHSQMVRPIVSEKLRYGRVSNAAEYVYDRPFQWGSKRTGPDLHRVGKKYSDMWHYRHMMDPRSVTPGSIMPNYPWLNKNKVKFKQLPKKLSVLEALGAPYSAQEIDQAAINAKAQADVIMKGLVVDGVPEKMVDKEIIALIAYLQRLGTDMGGSDEVSSVE